MESQYGVISYSVLITIITFSFLFQNDFDCVYYRDPQNVNGLFSRLSVQWAISRTGQKKTTFKNVDLLVFINLFGFFWSISL